MQIKEENKLVSIVIPTYKSEENLPILLERLKSVLLNSSHNYEVIIVDDNSPDNSLSILERICSSDRHIKVISLSRNFGQQIAISAGLKYAQGDAVIIMDDDLQDPPEFIPSLLKKWEEGYDVVYAVRKSRSEFLLKRLGYRIFYRLLNRFSHIHIPKDSGDFGLLDRKIVEIINSMPERVRFVRGLRAWIGFKQVGVECARASRHKGKPAYGLFKIIKLSTDGIFTFSDLPIQVYSFIGFFISFLAFLGMIFTVIQKIATYFLPVNPLAVWQGFSTIVLSILFLGGIQLIGIGILGEYIARIYNEVKSRPMFLVKKTINLAEDRNKP